MSVDLHVGTLVGMEGQDADETLRGHVAVRSTSPRAIGLTLRVERSELRLELPCEWPLKERTSADSVLSLRLLQCLSVVSQNQIESVHN